MKDFLGKYVGFAPTDESDVRMGEIEAVISDEKIAIRMATGLAIEQEELPTSIFQSMSTHQILGEFNPGTGPHEDVVGFIANEGHPILLFLPDETPGKFQLVVRTSGMGEILGPTILFGTDQEEKFEEAIKAIETSFGKSGVVPRLLNDGKAEQ